MKVKLLLSALLSVVFLFTSYGYAKGVDEDIKINCGTHPVLTYIKEYKSSLMDSEMLVRAEECASGIADAEIWKWKLADVNVKGCLVRKYGYEKLYIDSIASMLKEAKEMVNDQIASYNTCTIKVREKRLGTPAAEINNRRNNGIKYVTWGAKGNEKIRYMAKYDNGIFLNAPSGNWDNATPSNEIAYFTQDGSRWFAKIDGTYFKNISHTKKGNWHPSNEIIYLDWNDKPQSISVSDFPGRL